MRACASGREQGEWALVAWGVKAEGLKLLLVVCGHVKNCAWEGSEGMGDFVVVEGEIVELVGVKGNCLRERNSIGRGRGNRTFVGKFVRPRGRKSQTSKERNENFKTSQGLLCFLRTCVSGR